MSLTLTTYDWVPEFVRGYVRDIRVRWALAEAGEDYAVETVPIRPKSPAHLARQPFGQVPLLRDGEIELFETGAILLHLGEGRTALMPQDPAGRAETLQWTIAALNSIEPLAKMWEIARVFDKDAAAEERAAGRLQPRLAALDKVLAGRDWLAGGRFTVADIVMADALRLVGDEGALESHPALRAYVARATGRPAYGQAMAAHMAHWEAADAARAAAG